ncbi:MAG: hypothetical protein PHI97_33335 [Desulfobulbus sp.]|nr:hypothetical protein [Desulfobulbus sp.]
MQRTQKSIEQASLAGYHGMRSGISAEDVAAFFAQGTKGFGYFYRYYRPVHLTE